MTPRSEVVKKEHSDNIEFLKNELKSLGIVESDQHVYSQLDDKLKELKTLAENVKEVYYQAYKTAYT